MREHHDECSKAIAFVQQSGSHELPFGAVHASRDLIKPAQPHTNEEVPWQKPKQHWIRSLNKRGCNPSRILSAQPCIRRTSRRVMQGGTSKTPFMVSGSDTRFIRY